MADLVTIDSAEWQLDQSVAGVPADRTGWILLLERIIFAAVVANLAALVFFWFQPHHSVLFREHGQIENLHVAILVLGVIASLVATRVAGSVTYTISWLFVIAMVTGAVREVDVKSLHGPDWWNWLTHKLSLQEILLFAGAFTLLGYVWLQRRHLGAIVRRLLKAYAMPFHLGVVLVFLGAYAMEKLIPKGSFSLAAEEMLETSGYLLLLVGILRTLDLALYERGSASVIGAT